MYYDCFLISPLHGDRLWEFSTWSFQPKHRASIARVLFRLTDLNCKFWIGHVRYINILTWLRGFQSKTTNLLPNSFFVLGNSYKRLRHNERNTRFSWKRRSHVKILMTSSSFLVIESKCDIFSSLFCSSSPLCVWVHGKFFYIEWCFAQCSKLFFSIITLQLEICVEWYFYFVFTVVSK